MFWISFVILRIETNPINVSSLEIIRMEEEKDNDDHNSFRNVQVAQYNDDLILYITSNKLEWNIIPFDNEIYRIKKSSGFYETFSFPNMKEPINSLNIDHKNEYIIISTNRSIKSYKIGCDKDNPLKQLKNLELQHVPLIINTRNMLQFVMTNIAKSNSKNL